MATRWRAFWTRVQDSETRGRWLFSAFGIDEAASLAGARRLVWDENIWIYDVSVEYYSDASISWRFGSCRPSRIVLMILLWAYVFVRSNYWSICRLYPGYARNHRRGFHVACERQSEFRGRFLLACDGNMHGRAWFDGMRRSNEHA